jgi:hypothetical protein
MHQVRQCHSPFAEQPHSKGKRKESNTPTTKALPDRTKKANCFLFF